MPSYLESLTLKSITDPTGSRVGSAAITPFCTATPELVTSPLQYAVALNAMRAPGAGGALGSKSRSRASGSIENFESGMVTSYSDTNPPIARRVTTPFNRIDCASRIRRRSPSNYGYRRNSKGERAWVQASVLNRLLVLDEREAPAPPDEREG